MGGNFNFMRKLVKFFLFIVAIGVALGLLPFTIGGLAGWLICKNIADNRVKYGLLAVVGILTVFFGSAWIVALNSSSKQPNTQTKLTPTIAQNTRSYLKTLTILLF